MAFGFFRRHQKMVMIIMVILMVAFLIGFQGFSNAFSRSPGKEVIGKTALGDITLADQLQAELDLRILDSILPRDPRARAIETVDAYQLLSTMGERDRETAYFLLLAEAKHHKVRVSEADIDSLLTALNCPPGDENYKALLANMATRLRVTEKQFRGAIERWLMIHKLYATSLVLTPPSEREVSFVSRDLVEKIDLRVLVFRAEAFLDQVPKEVDANAVEAQFSRYRTLPAGQASEQSPMGFGYFQPDRVQIAYAFLARQPIERAVRPSDKEADDYFVLHSAEFTKAGPDPNGPRVPMTAEEARPLIADKLAAERVSAKMDELAKKFQAALGTAPASGPGSMPASAAAPSYDAARNRMLLPAEAAAALDKQIDTTSIGSAKLSAAVDRLAALAGLKAIAFPWGEHESKSLSPDITVRLEGPMTLREALARLCEQAKWPAIEWGMCAGLEGALFPLSGEGAVDFFPISVRLTGPMDAQQVRDDPILGRTVLGGAQQAGVLHMAFTAQGFGNRRLQGQTWAPMKEGQDGPAMNVLGRRSGTLYWRLVKATPGQAPARMTDEIRAQVEKDIRLQKAYDLAYQRAEKIRSSEQFQAADANGEANAISTGPFARMDMRGGSPVPPELELPPDAEIHRKFLETAFSLAPTDGPGAEIGLLRVPAKREVLVLRRVGFEPLTREMYQNTYRTQVMYSMIMQEFDVSKRVWLGEVVRRVEYVPARGGGGGPEGALPEGE